MPVREKEGVRERISTRLTRKFRDQYLSPMVKKKNYTDRKHRERERVMTNRMNDK